MPVASNAFWTQILILKNNLIKKMVGTAENKQRHFFCYILLVKNLSTDFTLIYNEIVIEPDVSFFLI